LTLIQIQDEVRLRAGEIASAHGNWPCRKGCAECCRQLASEPRVSRDEWLLLDRALKGLPADIAEAARRRIRDSVGRPRPVICPLLHADSGTCLVYEARPIPCRAYGFYTERGDVLGCSQIESLSRESPDVVWGNHAALEDRMRQMGPAMELSAWLGATA
jgi:Fe-S-cluster containining protein